MSPNEQAAVAAAGGALGVSIVMIAILGVVWWLLLIIARWKIFTKAGEAGWKSIIPIYADYVQWRIGWKRTGLFWAAIALVILGCILAVASGALVVNAKGALTAGGGGGFLAIIGVVCIIAGAIMELIATYKLFVSFGKGVGWFILWILFPNIVLLVLGFGSAQHQGAQD